MINRHCTIRTAAPYLVLPFVLVACNGTIPDTNSADGEGGSTYVEDGQDFFRNGTFGTEGFWTEAVQLPQGLEQSGFTLLDALTLGLQVDSDELDSAELNALVNELGTDLSAANAPLLNDSLVFQDLLTRNAIVGLVADDVNMDGLLDGDVGETLGLSCALCHSVVDGEFFNGNEYVGVLSGSIGKRVDGPGAVVLDHGALLSVARNSRAIYPHLPISLNAIGGDPISRTGVVATVNSSELAIDLLLLDLDAFPIGQADMLPDGIGAPVTMPPVFGVRPIGPYGVAGEFVRLVDSVNFHILVGLDPTTIVDTAGAIFLNDMAPDIGLQITNETSSILTETGVRSPFGGYPYVDAPLGNPSGGPFAPFGRRVDEYALRTMALYLQQLRAPARPPGDPEAIARGEIVYMAQCVVCHGDPLDPMPLGLIPADIMLYNYSPTTLLVRGFPYTNMRDDRLSTYDDRLVLFDRIFEESQEPTLPRDYATPRLTGVFLRNQLLHNGSVPNLEALLDPARGPAAPHAIYVQQPLRSDVIEYLRSEL